jgi:hypothetical protein
MKIVTYESTNNSFQSGDIQQCDNDTLQKHLLLLCSRHENNESIRHRDIIRGITINHIILQRHIDGLNKQNEKTQRRVVALTIAALIAAAAQAITAILPYAGIVPKPPIAAALQTPAPQSTDPIPATHPSSGQPTKK